VERDFYYQVKENKDDYEDWIVGNVGYLASFNGKGFNGGFAKAGYEKLKNGGQRYRDYYQESKRNILKQRKDIVDIRLGCCDYRDWSPFVNTHNCVIYCDPPYFETTSYDKADVNYDEFWQTMREWSKNNIVLISELQAPDDFKCVWEQSVSRSLNASNKGTATEKLFIYNP
jgi:DNA adenine methylase